MHELPISACRLDKGGLRKQRDRYQSLGRRVVRVQRSPQELIVTFADDVDAELLAETIAIESECCPFFQLRYEPRACELVVGVSDPAHAPALDAIVAALQSRS